MEALDEGGPRINSSSPCAGAKPVVSYHPIRSSGGTRRNSHLVNDPLHLGHQQLLPPRLLVPDSCSSQPSKRSERDDIPDAVSEILHQLFEAS